MKDELDRMRSAAWAVFGSRKEATDHLTNPDLQAGLFDSTAPPVLCYAEKTWADTAVARLIPLERRFRRAHNAPGVKFLRKFQQIFK